MALFRASRRLFAVDPARLFDSAKAAGIGFFSGVPDSLLKDFCAYVTDNTSPAEHVIAANEGVAVGLAAGYHLATGKVPMVYTQNSGFGNMINPLLSLAHPQVYGIPMVVLVGWRGEPGVKDEPQHRVMGDCQEDMLKAIGMNYEVLPKDQVEAEECLKRVTDKAKELNAPVALLVKKASFTKYKLKGKESHIHASARMGLDMNREQALETVTVAAPNSLIVGTTGVLSRELFEIRDRKFQGDHSKDFLCVGNMGHTSAVAAGLAAFAPEKDVICLDGDGALLMHLGSITNVAQSFESHNLTHVLINNGLHESVGGQPTVGFQIDFLAMAKAAGFKSVERVETRNALVKALEHKTLGPRFIEVRVLPGVRADLGRPTTTPQENKKAFMKKVAEH